jgi:hypothetical protein
MRTFDGDSIESTILYNIDRAKKGLLFEKKPTFKQDL